MSSVDLRGRSFLSLEDLSERRMRDGDHGRPLEGVTVALLFLNPSLRTRLAGETAMAELGGHAAVLVPGSDAWKLEFGDNIVMDGDRVEHVRDAVGAIGGMCRAIGLRSFGQLQNWAEDAAEPVLKAVVDASPVPVVNLESPQDHPLQALADLLALKDHVGEDLSSRLFTLTWTPHPKPLPMAVPHAVLRMASRAGMHIRVACPEQFAPNPEFLDRMRRNAEAGGGGLTVTNDQHDGIANAEAVYAKSWGAPAYYGRWDEEANLRASASHWTVDRELMAAASEGAKFMHCLPMRRNVVATDDVVEGADSLVRTQAENRLHVQKAVFQEMLRK
ncbi:MAG: N-acetylornithine carbamoyltransferase [Planctomycetota bacterium]|jgi:N-acetylornithine carbamoyltransferase